MGCYYPSTSGHTLYNSICLAFYLKFDLLKLYIDVSINDFMSLNQITCYFISELFLHITQICNRSTIITLILMREDAEKLFNQHTLIK